MPNSKIPSPARSQGVISTPRRQLLRTRSVSSPTRTNLRLSSIIESYKVSPVLNRQSILNDNTDIEMPRRNSWWKKIDDNSRDVLELLEKKEIVEVNNVAEEFDVEVLSQEKKNYTLDLPDSSDAESINSIVIPQRKLFTQKENHPQIKFRQIKNNRETLQKLNKSYTEQDNEFNSKRKTLFSQPYKPRTKPVFPAALLDISANKTANKTKEIPAAKVKGQVRSLFGGRPGTKRKNMFADFIVSESEEEISEIQPKVFGFQKRNEPKRRGSLMSRQSQTSSIDLEMEDWILLPSSTMMENQVDEQTSPVKRIKLSYQLESKNSDVNTNSNNTINKTKQVNKSVSSKNKSKNLSNINYEDDKNNEINITPRNTTANNSRVTRSMRKSLRENSVTASNVSKTLNNSNIQIKTKKGKNIKNASQRPSHTVQERQTMSIEEPDPDEDFTLEYDNNDNEAVLEIGTSLKNHNISPKDKTANLNLNVVDDKNNFVKESSRMIREENFVEQEKSTNNMCENEADLLNNKENDIECNRVSNSSVVQNNSQEISKMTEVNKKCKTNVLILNKQDKNKSKSIRISVENHNQECRDKDLQEDRMSEKLSLNKNVKKNVKLNKSSQHFINENPKEQEIDSEHNEGDNNSEHTNIEKANVAKQFADNSDNEIEEEINVSEHQECGRVKNVTEEAIEDVQEVTNITNTDERDKEIMLNYQNDNLQDKTRLSSSNVRHDTTKGNIKKYKSPEVILYNETKQIDSFTVPGRNTSVRKTKSIIFHNKLETVRDLRKSTGFPDETGNSSAEGSFWDSHRTTRKTLRQTFGKDFTPRKSLRALVMEKTAKLQANFTEIVENIKNPQANSTEYDHVQGEMYSYQETELEEVEGNIEMVQGDKSKETIQIKEYQKVNVRDVTERIEEKNKDEQLQRRNENEQSDESDDMGESESIGKNKSQKLKDKKEVEESEYREGTEELEAMEEIEQSEGREMEDSKQNGETVVAEEGEEEAEVREKIEESAERVEMEESAEKEEMEESAEKEELQESEKREETEQSENERDETEELEEKDETVQFEERDEMEESAEREMEESDEREETEQSENEERDETVQFEERDEMEESAERELEESDEREETEQSENEERDATVQSEGDEIQQSADREDVEESDESEEMEESDEEEEMEESDEGEEMEQSDNEEWGQTERFEDGDGDSAQQFEEDETVPDDEIRVEGADRRRSSASPPRRSAGTSLEAYIQRIKENNAEERRKMREQLRNSLKNPRGETFFPAGGAARKPPRATKIQKPRPKRNDPAIPPGTLPAEIVEDMKYRPPKRFRPPGASWITRRLYGFLETKLEPRYSYRARVRAERVVRRLHELARAARRPADLREDAEEVKREMARLDLVTTHFDFYEFCREFLPREIRVKIVPDIVNDIPLPRPGVFSDILQ